MNNSDNTLFGFNVKGTGIKKINYNIGDKGPGGGIVFYARGNQYKECSGMMH